MRWHVLKNQGGFTLLELIVSTTVISIIILSSVQLFASNITSLGLARARTAGLALANEKMEYLRDLPYDSLATQHGTIFPPGNIPDDQNLTRDNINFRVHTVINYVDDPFDGNLDGTIQGKPKDLYPYDYKRAEISVYTVNGNVKVASLTSNVAGKAAETASNTGILRITVLNANGQPVSDASVHIVNTAANPDVDITTTTDSSGLVVIPKLPPDSSHNYQIFVSKAGYSSDQTYPDPAGTQTAVNVNPNILAQQISDVTFSIDATSTMNVNVVDTSGNPVANQAITITGAKKIYANPDTFKYSQTVNTDSSGNISLGNMEWDSYTLTIGGGYQIVTTAPYQPVGLNPGQTLSVKMVVTLSGSWPRITGVSPGSDSTGSPTTVVISGANFANDATVKLSQSGQPDINGTSTSVSGGNQITTTFDLTSAATGAWDIVVSSGGQQVTQPGGFNVAP